MEPIMQVSKWGNSLAIRLPKALVEEMGLKEGDEVTLAKSSESHFDLVKRSRAEAIKRELLKFGWKLPEDYKFDRDDANER